MLSPALMLAGFLTLARAVVALLLLMSLPPSSGKDNAAGVSTDRPSSSATTSSSTTTALQSEVWQNGYATVRAAVLRADVPRILREVLAHARMRQQECDQCSEQEVRTGGYNE